MQVVETFPPRLTSLPFPFPPGSASLAVVSPAPAPGPGPIPRPPREQADGQPGVAEALVSRRWRHAGTHTPLLFSLLWEESGWTVPMCEPVPTSCLPPSRSLVPPLRIPRWSYTSTMPVWPQMTFEPSEWLCLGGCRSQGRGGGQSQALMGLSAVGGMDSALTHPSWSEAHPIPHGLLNPGEVGKSSEVQRKCWPDSNYFLQKV